MRQLVQMPVVEEYIPFNGGLDTVTPQMVVNPGTARDSENVFQDINSGYSTGLAYERFDGQALPSDAVYSMLESVITGTIAVGDTLLDSGTATGVVIAVQAAAIALTKVTGTFITGNILVGAVVVGTCTGPEVDNAATSIELNSMYNNLAADQYRADITAVTTVGDPGSGSVLGVVYYSGVVYAFRDDVGATETNVYKDTAAGWVKVDLGSTVAYTHGGVAAIVPGDTITGATSTETAVVTKVTLDVGTSWAGGDAAGTLYLKDQSGAFQAENLDTPTQANIATIAGDSTAVSLNPGGNYEFIIANFGAESGTEYVYGCSGVDAAFEFRGDALLKIDRVVAGSEVNPTHIEEFKYRLVLSYGPGVSISVAADPFDGASATSGTIFVQETVTGLQVQAGQQDTGTLAIYQRNSLDMLYDKGDGDVANWKNVAYNTGTGAVEWSPQVLGNSYFLDDRGFMNLTTAQGYGNFYDAAESNQILDWISSRKNLLTHSCVIREKNLVCLFFSDKYALYITINRGEVVALMPQKFTHDVTRVWSSEDSNGDEVVYFGSSDGFVYQLGKGTSFDGGDLEWWLDLAYSHFKSPYRMKRYRRAIIEIVGDGFAKFYFGYSLGYASTDIAQPGEVLSDTNLKRSQWDVFIWDAFYWDGVSLAPSDLRMTGTGENLSVKLRGASDYYDQIRFSGVLIQYSPTRRKR